MKRKFKAVPGKGIVASRIYEGALPMKEGDLLIIDTKQELGKKNIRLIRDWWNYLEPDYSGVAYADRYSFWEGNAYPSSETEFRPVSRQDPDRSYIYNRKTPSPTKVSERVYTLEPTGDNYSKLDSDFYEITPGYFMTFDAVDERLKKPLARKQFPDRFLVCFEYV